MKTTAMRLLVGMLGAMCALAGCARISGADGERAEASISAASPTSRSLVIRQVYGGGGEPGASFTHDYVELVNRGADSIDLRGVALQIASADAPFFKSPDPIALPPTVLKPGQSFLVQLGSGGAVGAELPSADLVAEPAPSLGATAAKVALVRVSDPLDGCGGSFAPPCASRQIIDMLGYGEASQANGEVAPALDPQTAATRREGGCVDTSNNAADFERTPPSPRSRASEHAACTQATDAGAPDADASIVAAKVLLNEIELDPPTDEDSPFEFIELSCSALARLTGYYVVAVRDGAPDDSRLGIAYRVIDLSHETCGANGLVLLKAPGGHAARSPETTVVLTEVLAADGGAPSGALDNDSSFLVVRSPSAPLVEGVDYDRDDNGSLELPPDALVIDAVASAGEGAPARRYAPTVFTASERVGGVTRSVGDDRTVNADAWYAAPLVTRGAHADGVEYESSEASRTTPPGAGLTPGGENAASRPQKNPLDSPGDDSSNHGEASSTAQPSAPRSADAGGRPEEATSTARTSCAFAGGPERESNRASGRARRVRARSPPSSPSCDRASQGCGVDDVKEGLRRRPGRARARARAMQLQSTLAKKGVRHEHRGPDRIGAVRSDRLQTGHGQTCGGRDVPVARAGLDRRRRDRPHRHLVRT